MQAQEAAGMDSKSAEPKGTRGRRADAYVPPAAFRAGELLEMVARVRPLEGERQKRLFGDGGQKAAGGSVPQPIYLAGDESLLSRRCVAIVGTRQVSEAGRKRARRLARELVEAGTVIVSGLAKGVDTEALEAALEAGGRVVAVIGTPLERAYPAENKRLQERIYREHLLVSPVPAGTAVQPYHFPQRNRVMAALSDATAIIEASDTSGTLHQAAECTRLGRWLFIAKSVMEDSALKWPRSFTNYERTRTLTETADVLVVLPR